MLFPVAPSGAQTAQARLDCLSLRFERGSTADGNFTLDLGTLPPPAPPNGELAPTFASPTPSAVFCLSGVIFEEPVSGTLQVDVALAPDANGIGFSVASRPVVSGEICPSPCRPRVRATRGERDEG